jgi:hypothetical protein
VSLGSVLDRVEAAAARAGRSTSEITVVVVSKGRSAAEIEAVYRRGHRDFAENRAQELVAKRSELAADVSAGIRWHFVGPLQSNKVRLVRPAVTLLHSLDRESLAPAWLKGPGLAPPALLQVNVGGEPQKHGVDPDLVVDTCGRLIALGVDLRGLMTIPPVPERPEDARPHFARLRRLRDGVMAEYPSVRELSMGMTDDFEVAVEEGATLIRPGRAIFGT